MSELMAVKGDNVTMRPRRRNPPMARMSAAFDTDFKGQNMIVVYEGNQPFGEIANAAAATHKKPPSFGEIMKKASAKAFRGGVAGMAAGVVQVGAFMWMRTLMNYQSTPDLIISTALTGLGGQPEVKYTAQGSKCSSVIVTDRLDFVRLSVFTRRKNARRAAVTYANGGTLGDAFQALMKQ
eukprot:3244007-Pyramimonas_sp.AAC.1